MNRGQRRRCTIFNKYTENYKLLSDNGILSKLDPLEYVCPICLSKFHSLETEGNPLTLEDAPPKSLGGKANTLTCQSCNNFCGRHIDFHLTEKLREIDSAEFLPGTNTKVSVSIDGEIFRGEISVDDEGVMKMIHSKKNNHPDKLDSTIENFEDGKIIDM